MKRTDRKDTYVVYVYLNYVVYVYLNYAKRIKQTLMKNHTFWVIPYVLHSFIIGFTLAPLLTISLFTNHLLATRHCIVELA